MFRNYTSFYGEELFAPHPTPKLEDHPLSAVRDCLFNIFAATLHTVGRSSARNLRTRHVVLTGTLFMETRSRLACWPLVPEFAGSNPTEVVGFFRYMKKSSACLPSEGKCPMSQLCGM
jgi:hypothetical protein